MTIFHIVHMVVIDTQCSLESFRRFIIESTCSSYIPESYASDYEIFAERDADLGSIYVEANLQRVNVFSLDFFPHSSILHFL